MPYRDLSLTDQAIVRQCLAYVLRSGQLSGEFEVRLGVAPSEVEELLGREDSLNDDDDASRACLAINNALNEVCHGLRIDDAEWSRWFTCSRAEVGDVYRRWSLGRGWSRTGLM